MATLNYYDGVEWQPVSGLTVYAGGGGTPTGDYTVRFIDYDGTILKTQLVVSGGSATPPLDPSHAGLTFQGWNYSSTELSGITSNLDVGAMYITTDGKTHLFITLTTASGLSPTFYFKKADVSTLTIDYGDGNTGTTSSAGNVTFSHTYAAAGDYEVTVWISTGSGTFSFGGGTTSTTVVGTNLQEYRSTLTKVFVGADVITLQAQSFYKCYSLTEISIPSSVTSLGASVFYSCYKLKAITIPDEVTSIPTNSFLYGCSSLQSVSIPMSVTLIGLMAFQSCASLGSIVIPNSVTSMGDTMFNACGSLREVILPDSITSNLGSSFFYGCYLESVVVGSGITAINNSTVFAYCSSLKSVVFRGPITSIGKYAFRECYSLNSIELPSSLTSIAANAFYGCYGMKFYIINATSVPTLAATSAFTGINSTCKIYVPDASVDAYKAASNWSTYANYIYPLSEYGG